MGDPAFHKGSCQPQRQTQWGDSCVVAELHWKFVSGVGEISSDK